MFKIRKATLVDIHVIRRLASIVFPATYKEILSPEQLNYMMDWMYSAESLQKQMTEEGHIYYLAFKDGKPAGYFSIQPEGEHVFHLQKIYVLPFFQGMKLGKFLFEQAIKAIKELHPEPCQMRLNVNRQNKALGFYQKMGMTKVDEGDFPIGNGYFMNDYIMGLDI
ncbi:MAG: GNAT family N-acetyltransferase [Bacteroidaceae bacterium]|nr:GNAT family N-acetyltransferase [Bacteroidaceae bacterium]MBQ8889052.1 GNAT family N-acetyltransferase [Bacteroidaceae bacterium]